MLKRLKSLGIMVVTLCMVVVGCMQEISASAVSTPTQEPETGVSTYDIVYTGRYPQTEITGKALTQSIVNATYDAQGTAEVDGKTYVRVNRKNTLDSTYGYYQVEPMAWRVLKIDGRTVTLQSLYGIDSQPYEQEQSDGSVWKLEEWLNDTFLTTAFSQDELDGLLGAEDNKVNILSKKQITDGSYGMSVALDRSVMLSDYAQAVGAVANSVYGNIKGSYWTSTVSSDNKVSCVNYLGGIDEKAADTEGVAVVPIIQMTLDGGYYAAFNPTLDLPHYDEEKEETAWEYVAFGSYPQSEVTDVTAAVRTANYEGDTATVNGVRYKRISVNGTYRYFQYKPIAWKVLEDKDGELLLQARDILDSYNGTNATGSYSESKLHTFLDADFYNTAFTVAQKKQLLAQSMGNILIPNDDEVHNKAYGYVTDATRTAAVTEYAVANGVSDVDGKGAYWIRSDKDNSHLDGFIDSKGTGVYSVFSGNKGIVPIVRVKKCPYTWEKYVNQNDDGTNDDTATNTPVKPSNTNPFSDSITLPKYFTKTKPIVTVKNLTSTKQKISWKKVGGATGYIVYKAKGNSSGFHYAGKTTALKMTLSKLQRGKRYYYKVVAYKNNQGMTQYSYASKIVNKVCGAPKTPTLSIKKKKYGSKTMVILRWDTFDAQKIVVYRKSGKGKYKKLLNVSLSKSFKKGARIEYTYSKGTYRFKIRTYNVIGKKKYYSGYSKTRKITL